MWGLETLSETEGPVENLVQPLHTTERGAESQGDAVIHSGSWRGQTPIQNFWIQILRSLNRLSQTLVHTHSVWGVSLSLGVLTALLTANTDSHILRDRDLSCFFVFCFNFPQKPGLSFRDDFHALKGPF